MDYTRGDFLKTIVTAAISAAGASLFPSQIRGAGGNDKGYSVIPKEGTVLFQGDSITDFGRDEKNLKANSGLGHGYAFLATAYLRDELAVRHVQCYNRGISGNKVFQLADRWDKDCLQLQPDLLSILVGVNDFWHTLTHGYEGTVEVYEHDYRSLLKRTKKELPNTKIVIGEPYAVMEGTAVSEKWFPKFNEYRQAARQIARDFDAAFIPYQSVYDEASKKVAPTYWTADGVHPTLAGSQLMAHAWLETVKRM